MTTLELHINGEFFDKIDFLTPSFSRQPIEKRSLMKEAYIKEKASSFLFDKWKEISKYGNYELYVILESKGEQAE